MKRLFKAITLYFSFCIFGTLIAAVFCMLCMNVTNLVIGTRLPLFSMPLFIKALFLSFPVVAILALLLLVLYFIRHNIHSVLSLLVYVALGALTWGFLTPQTLRLSLSYDMRFAITNSVVSPGYFREEDNGLVYYWASVAEDGTGEGFFIDLYGIYGKAGAVYSLEHAEVVKKAQSVFADALVDSAIKTPKVVSSPLAVYLHLLYQGRDAVSRGYIAWLCFASLGLTLLALYAFGWLSAWRLLNAFIVMIAGVGVVFLNYLLTTHARLAALSELWLTKLGAIADILSLSTCVNLLLALLFVLIGIIRHFTRKEPVAALTAGGAE